MLLWTLHFHYLLKYTFQKENQFEQDFFSPPSSGRRRGTVMEWKHANILQFISIIGNWRQVWHTGHDTIMWFFFKPSLDSFLPACLVVWWPQPWKQCKSFLSTRWHATILLHGWFCCTRRVLSTRQQWIIRFHYSHVINYTEGCSQKLTVFNSSFFYNYL